MQHPSLRSQLRTLYTATLPPPPDAPEPHHRFNRGQRGGYRGRHRERPRGPWAQEKGDAYALRILRGMRKGEGGEGLVEFGRLVELVMGGQGREEGRNGQV